MKSVVLSAFGTVIISLIILILLVCKYDVFELYVLFIFLCFAMILQIYVFIRSIKIDRQQTTESQPLIDNFYKL